jgi:hypothetical protein
MSIVMFPLLLSPSTPPTPSILSVTLVRFPIPHLVSTTSLSQRVLKLSVHLVTSWRIRQLSATSRSLLRNPIPGRLFHCPNVSRSVFGTFAAPSSRRSKLQRTPSHFSRESLAKALLGRIIGRRSTRKISCLVASTAVSLPEKAFSARKHSNRTSAIVKLFLRFAGQDKHAPWAMGTGWLINNDTIVTAGHCSYDWSHNLGRLTHVKAYIGYYGKESIKDSRNYAVQFRTGKRVAVSQGWLAGENNEPRDVSFIQVDRPYTGITPIKYRPTPSIGTKLVLGVVGYPGDLMNPKSKEKGAVRFPLRVP